MDLVTVIVPIYNVEKYLVRCVESIINQTYTNLEIILIDDGSPDKCGEICENFEDNRIKVIHQPNKGLSSARNSGLEISTGAWITFIDSDDFVDKDYIETLLSLCKENNTLISQCGAVRGNEDIFPVETVKIIEKRWEFCELYTSPTREYRTIAWGKLYHKSLFTDLRFPEGKINEDEDTIFKIMYLAGSVVITNRHLYYYYMSPISILRSEKKNINFDFVDIFNDRIIFLKQRNENILINTTKKELCLRLMLNYFEAQKINAPSEEIKRLRILFKEYYKTIEIDNISRKERYALLLFYMLPNIFSFIENNLCIIGKYKIFREKK